MERKRGSVDDTLPNTFGKGGGGSNVGYCA